MSTRSRGRSFTARWTTAISTSAGSFRSCGEGDAELAAVQAAWRARLPRRTAGALGPVVFTPLSHAHPLIGFVVPAALLVAIVPAALPRPASAKRLC